MGKPNPVCQPKEARLHNLREVSLGLSKKISQDEARRCPQCATATCLGGCPLGIDIPGFIRLLREGDTVLALERIRKENPFPAICGRICPAPCEDACVFHADGEPIAIRALERFAADFGQPKAEKAVSPQGAKVAVIGSGPAGMSAAYYLARANCSVTMFEAGHEPGGLLRYGVPEMRLPQKILDDQFAQLRLWGVQVRTDVIFGRMLGLDELLMQGFAAVLLATGAGRPRFGDWPGSSFSGVYYDVEFLNRLQVVGKEDVSGAAARQGMSAAQTVVIGRGPAAFDVARLSLRLGGPVTMVFDGFEEEAGVHGDLLKEAKDEGLEISSMQALEIVGDDNGFVKGVKCRKLDVVENKDGLALAASNEEPIVLQAQRVIIANGYEPQVPPLPDKDRVFSCGVSASVVEAIAAGKAAAQKIIQHTGKS